MTNKARYIMIGGFLGAGKSTAVLALARYLKDQGKRVGLITNDQSVGLVDTTMMKTAGFATEEIAGGCFCCRFDSLVEAAESLNAQNRPEVFIAEPVGSCTDLVATVSYPLRRIYGDRYAISPLSVMVDPIRASRILGLCEGRSFSSKVVYVYRKQLEEASIIVINKKDMLDDNSLVRLTDAMRSKFPSAKVISVSARSGERLNEWFDHIAGTDCEEQQAIPIDYDTYADGEALLGWLNSTVRVSSEEAFDGEVFMMNLAERIQRELGEIDGEIAHLKMTLTADHQDGRAAILNLVNNDFVPELSQSLPEKLRSGELIINLRAEADPQALDRICRKSIQHESHKFGTILCRIEHTEHFRPSRPTPTWRTAPAENLSAGTQINT